MGTGTTIRMPHVFDILSVLANITSTRDRNLSLTPRTKSNDIASGEICQFMSGLEAEAEVFAEMNPGFFFITCRVLTDISSVDSFGSCANVSFPVVFKGGHYYIIIGEENTPVYRVHQPAKLFFTPEGKMILKRLLRKNHNLTGELDFFVDEDGKQSMYCIPKFTCEDVFPGARWEDCNVSDINTMLPHPLVNQPIVPEPHKFSVQVLELSSDRENIVDIFQTENDEE